jgi:transcriptional regulator with XRE-family HTH domain
MEFGDFPRPLPPLSEHRRRRLSLRLSIFALAVRSGIPPTEISRFERGEKELTPERLAALEAALEARPR